MPYLVQTLYIYGLKIDSLCNAILMQGLHLTIKISSAAFIIFMIMNEHSLGYYLGLPYRYEVDTGIFDT